MAGCGVIHWKESGKWKTFVFSALWKNTQSNVPKRDETINIENKFNIHFISLYVVFMELNRKIYWFIILVLDPIVFIRFVIFIDEASYSKLSILHKYRVLFTLFNAVIFMLWIKSTSILLFVPFTPIRNVSLQYYIFKPFTGSSKCPMWFLLT